VDNKPGELLKDVQLQTRREPEAAYQTLLYGHFGRLSAVYNRTKQTIAMKGLFDYPDPDRNDQDLTSDFDDHRYPQKFETYSSVIPNKVRVGKSRQVAQRSHVSTSEERASQVPAESLVWVMVGLPAGLVAPPFFASSPVKT